MLRKQIFFFFAILAVLIVNNWNIPLWDQDEAAYAGFAYNMNETGNWLVPNFMFSDVHRKPPLHFWNIAISYKIFGVNEFAVRFPSFLAVLGTILLMYFQGKKWLDNQVAFNGMVVISSSFLVTAIAKISVTDATLLFFSTLSAFGIINTLRKPNFLWIFLFWVGFGMGILTKGPPIVIFTGTFVFILFLVHHQRLNLLKLHPWFFAPIAISPAVLWGYFTYINDGGVFLNWMYDWYVLKRISGSVFGQTGPIGTHLLAICGFFLFYLMYIPNAFIHSVKGVLQKNETSTLLLSWFLAGWLLYEFSPSKLPAYTIAAHVPFAFMIALQIEKGIPFESIFDKIFTSFHFILFYILSLVVCIFPFFVELPNQIPIFVQMLGFILFGITSVLLLRYKSIYLHQYQLAGSLFFIFTAWAIVPQFEQLINSSKRVANALYENSKTEKTVYIGHNFGDQPSLPFYFLKNGFKPVNATGFSAEQLIEAYRSSPKSSFILNEEKYEYICNGTGSKPTYTKVSSFIIDRKGKSDYYIVGGQ